MKNVSYLTVIAALLFSSWAHSVVSTSNNNEKVTGDWERRALFANPYENGANIVFEMTTGAWKDRGLEGQYSLLLTKNEKAGTNKLFVQWLREGGVGEAEQEIAYSMSISEFNVRPEFSLSEPQCLNSKCSKVKLTATHVFEEISQEFFVEFTGLGYYQVSLAKSE